MTDTKTVQKVALNLNDELTIILSSVDHAMSSLPVGHPARTDLYEIRRSALRVTWDASSLINHTVAEEKRKAA